MSHRPWMPLYVADYLADTRDLTAEQHGVYLLILMLAWRRPTPTLPNDMGWIKSNLPAMHGHTFNRLVPALLDRFFILENDEWSNRRLTKERQNSDKLSAKQKQNADKRWAQAKENNALADAKAMPLQLQLQEKKDSKAIASAADAAPEPQPVYTDSKHELWGEGVAVLVQLGVSKQSAKSNIGRWLRDSKNDCPAVLGAIQRARDHRIIDPIPWITRAIATQDLRNATPKTDRSVVGAAHRLVERLAEWDSPAGCGEGGGNVGRLLSIR